MNAQKSMEAQRRILLVDDEDGVRHSWDRYLTDAGFEVDTAEDGEKAMLQLQTEPADVVISDLKMPGADGVELLQWLHDRHPGTRFILLTGYGNQEVERKVRELGAFEYLQKPVSPETLSMVVTAALLQQEKEAAEVGAPRGAEARPGAEAAEATEAVAPRGAETLPGAQAAEAMEVAAEPEREVRSSGTAQAEPAAHSGPLRTTLEVAGWLVAAPILGLAFVVFLPVIGFGAVLWTLGEILFRRNRPAHT